MPAVAAKFPSPYTNAEAGGSQSADIWGSSQSPAGAFCEMKADERIHRGGADGSHIIVNIIETYRKVKRKRK
jgi:hypothetical protein